MANYGPSSRKGSMEWKANGRFWPLLAVVAGRSRLFPARWPHRRPVDFNKADSRERRELSGLILSVAEVIAFERSFRWHTDKKSADLLDVPLSDFETHAPLDVETAVAFYSTFHNEGLEIAGKSLNEIAKVADTATREWLQTEHPQLFGEACNALQKTLQISELRINDEAHDQGALRQSSSENST